VIAPGERQRQQGEYKIRPYGTRDFLYQSAVVRFSLQEPNGRGCLWSQAGYGAE